MIFGGTFGKSFSDKDSSKDMHTNEVLRHVPRANVKSSQYIKKDGERSVGGVNWLYNHRHLGLVVKVLFPRFSGERCGWVFLYTFTAFDVCIIYMLGSLIGMHCCLCYR